jgi:hypothetical protein
MMDRGSISADITTRPAVSKTGKPGLEPGFLFVQETAFFATADRPRRPLARTQAPPNANATAAPTQKIIGSKSTPA